MLEEISQTLERLGLKESEVKVYLTCLEHIEGLFVSQITNLTGIKRSTVNLILERLVDKGFVTYHLDGSRKLFRAESPETLLFNLEDSLGDLRSLIPLLRIAAGDDRKTKIRFFEGKEGIEKIFTDILLTMKINKNPKREIIAISSGQDIFKVLPGHKKQFIDKRVRERIPIRWIAPEGDVSRKLHIVSQEEFRSMKFFDGKRYRFNVEVDIYANKIALIALEKEPTGVIIENESLTESFRSLFNLIWDSIR